MDIFNKTIKISKADLKNKKEIVVDLNSDGEWVLVKVANREMDNEQINLIKEGLKQISKYGTKIIECLNTTTERIKQLYVNRNVQYNPISGGCYFMYIMKIEGYTLPNRELVVHLSDGGHNGTYMTVHTPVENFLNEFKLIN